MAREEQGYNKTKAVSDSLIMHIKQHDETHLKVNLHSPVFRSQTLTVLSYEPLTSFLSSA